MCSSDLFFPQIELSILCFCSYSCGRVFRCGGFFLYCVRVCLSFTSLSNPVGVFSVWTISSFVCACAFVQIYTHTHLCVYVHVYVCVCVCGGGSCVSLCE